jgi:NTP pyrophosphatase (non-canonical NTP hydrolase)
MRAKPQGPRDEVSLMQGRSVDDWMAHEPIDEWEVMMKKIAAFHAKHDFAGQNGHDMGYRLALTIEELGELAAAVTKGKPIEECAEEMADVLILLMGHSLAMELDLKAAFESKYQRIMKREALQGRLGIRVTEYRPE